jgi:hypothetical protein
MLWGQWDTSDSEKIIETTFVISTRERTSLLSTPNKSLLLSVDEQKFWTRNTEYLPTDGIVKSKVNEILKPLPKNSNDIEKRALFMTGWLKTPLEILQRKAVG